MADGAHATPKKPKHHFRHVSSQRLSMYIIVLILLFFSISSYVQSAHNAALLHRAVIDRSKLIEASRKQADINKIEIDYIQKLIAIIKQQNALLDKAGQTVIVIPPSPQPGTHIVKPQVLPTPTVTISPSKGTANADNG